MVRCWFMDDTDEDPRAPHMTNPAQFLGVEELKQLTGVECLQFPADDIDSNEKYAVLKKDRGYTYEDTIHLSREVPNYEEKIKMLFKEHIHSDEEIRFVTDGGGYFDVRDTEDSWIRIELKKNDLLIVPSGIYHRFTLDMNEYLKARRLFCGVPVWTAINRPADEHPTRIDYLRKMGL